MLPSAESFSSFAPLKESTAISAQANTALSMMSATCKRSWPTMFPSMLYTILLFQIKYQKQISKGECAGEARAQQRSGRGKRCQNSTKKAQPAASGKAQVIPPFCLCGAILPELSLLSPSSMRKHTPLCYSQYCNDIINPRLLSSGAFYRRSAPPQRHARQHCIFRRIL